MICMEGLEVATVTDKVRQVEGGARLDPCRKVPGTSAPTLPGSEGGGRLEVEISV